MEPPCCMIPGCRFLCEKNFICVNLGKIGLKFFDDNRGPIMLFTAFIAILCTLLTIISLIGASYETENIKNCAWSYGETDNGDEIWVGLSAFVIEAGGVTDTTGWRNADCPNEENYCENCKSISLESISFVVINLITSIPNIKGALERSTKFGDRNCEKNFQVLTCIIGLFSSLISLSEYADKCARNLPNEIGTTTVTYKLGPGFICLLVATLLLAINFLTNLLTPVPQLDEKEINEHLRGPSDSKL